MKMMYSFITEMLVIVIVFLTLSEATLPDCDSASNSRQCSHSEICRNGQCFPTTHCKTDANCAQELLKCVTDYCQLDHCTTTGQCVYGQVCSHFQDRACAYPVETKVQENRTLILSFAEAAPESTQYAAIQWLKYSGGHFSKTAYFEQGFNNNKPLYSKEQKVKLNPKTGKLKLLNVQLEDEGKYYYWFRADDGVTDTGNRYEFDVEVIIIPHAHNIVMRGSSDCIPSGAQVNFTATVNRIKPPSMLMYWELTFDTKRKGQTMTVLNSDGTTYKQISSIQYMLTKQDHGKTLTFTLDPVYGKPIFKRTRINICRDALPDVILDQNFVPIVPVRSTDENQSNYGSRVKPFGRDT